MAKGRAALHLLSEEQLETRVKELLEGAVVQLREHADTLEAVVADLKTLPEVYGQLLEPVRNLNGGPVQTLHSVLGVCRDRARAAGPR